MKNFSNMILVLFVFFLGNQLLYGNPQLVIDFSSQAMGTYYGHPTHSPGDIIFIENGFPVKVDSFFWMSGGGTFANCHIDTYPDGFDTPNSMSVNNINLRFDFDEQGVQAQYVTFQYADCGGEENLIINGDGFVGELDALDQTMLGGVAVYVQTFFLECGKQGMVTLVGEMWQLQVGGQEFAVDNFNIYAPVIPLSRCVHFESQPLGNQYGGAVGNALQEVIFVENSIPVFVDSFFWSPRLGAFNFCEIYESFFDIGLMQIMWTNNINLGFDLTRLGFPAGYVQFEYGDLGGMENLSVNGDLRIGELTALDGTTVGGVMVEVTTQPCEAGHKGEVKLYGPVSEFKVGGQEFAVDNICVWADDPFDQCSRIIDHEQFPYQAFYGDNNGNTPGDIIHVKDGVPVSIWEFMYVTGGMAFSMAYIDSTLMGFGDGQTMMISNINVNYNFAATGYTPQQVSFEFYDGGGHENISVNGEPLYVGELLDAPQEIAPGVHIQFATLSTGGGYRGIAVIKGLVHELTIGGQEFWIDNICASNEVVGIAEDAMLTQQFRLGQNYPNPFNPTTSIACYLPQSGYVKMAVYNALGQQVTMLQDGFLPAGDHIITWDGKDQMLQEVCSGIYFYRIHTGNFTQTKKMVLIR
jgi:hypothetical protein